MAKSTTQVTQTSQCHVANVSLRLFFLLIYINPMWQFTSDISKSKEIILKKMIALKTYF
jgi:hypothetical protein